jgi:hypothetical protein
MGNLRSAILFNRVHTYCSSTCKYINSFLSSTVNCCYDRHNKWVFIPNHTCPVPLQYITNDVASDWVYHSTKNTLKSYHLDSKKPSEPNDFYKVDWLSVRLSIDTHNEHYEYDMDDFLSTFIICSTDKIPSLFCFFMSWCAYTKQWFPSNAIVTCHIIDSEGNERDLLVHEHTHVDIRLTLKIDNMV